MSWTVPSVTAALVGTVVLTTVYWYMYRQHRERFMGIWAVSWTIYAARLVFELLLQTRHDATMVLLGHQLTTLSSGILLLWGTRVFLGKPMSRWMGYGFVLVAAWIMSGVFNHFSWRLLNLPTFTFLGLIYIWTGTVLLRCREIDGLGKQFTGWGFVLWGIHKANYPFLAPVTWLAPWGYLIATILTLVVAAGTLLIYFEKIRRILSASESRFRMLAENAQDIVYRYRFTPVRGFEFVSPSATKIVGYTPEEHYADPDLVFKIAHPDDIPLLQDIRVLTGLNKEPMLLRFFRKDGTMVWTEHHNVPIYDENGNIVGFEGIARDVTGRKKAEEAVRESESRFREMLENLQLVTVILDLQGNIEFCNNFLLAITGWERQDVIGRNWFDTFVPPDSREKYRQFYLDWLSEINDPPYSLKENEIMTRHGELRRISWTTTFLKDPHGNITGLACFGEDITDRRQAEEALKRYELLSKHAADIILFFRRDGEIIEANDAAVKMYGYSREELLKINIHNLRAPQSRALLSEHIKQAENRGILFETFHQRKDGTIFPVEVSLHSTVLGDERVLFAIVRDITERKRAEETINHLAYHDPLTDLPNRLLFYDRLTLALAHARRSGRMLAVMFLDLDHFKIVNDMMGHAVGDQLLKDVGRQLKGCVRSDDTVARIGGDEFTILLPEINRAEDAAKVAEKINQTLKKAWILNGYEFHITTSIGIALYPNDGEDADTLTKNADTAMYRAKEHGNNYQFFNPSMNLKAIERLEIELSLRRAVEQNEFEVYYQPQVDISAGKIVGVEALVRWNHPERGQVLPIEFISVAEETGLIIPIGEWVLRTACAQNKAWQQAGYPPMRMAVNLSAYQFRQKQLVETVARALRETGMDPRYLELEITESTAMQDVEFTIAMLRSLREMGIRIALDDFGTGYSSLSYLRKFPITTLKVDRSFVRDVLTDPEDAAIVATIITLAQILKLNVIIEGVETEEELAFFEQQECFEMQGYLFSEPKPAGEIEKLLQKAAAVYEKGLKSV